MRYGWIKGRIYDVSSWLTVSSFAITSFLLQRQTHFPNSRLFYLVIDVAFLALLWVSYVRLKIDLWNARKCLEAREDLIRGLANDPEGNEFDPFPYVALDTQPRLRDNGLNWIVLFASVALVLKLLVVCFGIAGK
jgi:hypothetical protein